MLTRFTPRGGSLWGKVLGFPCRRDPDKEVRVARASSVGAWSQAEQKHEDPPFLPAGEFPRGYLCPGVPVGLAETFSEPFGVTPFPFLPRLLSQFRSDS